MKGVRIANAPVSYGVFELTIGLPGLPEPDALLAAIAAAGYEGTELGPPGYFGDGPALGERLARHGLALAGGWAQLRLSEPEHGFDGLQTLAGALDLFAAAGAAEQRAPRQGRLLPRQGCRRGRDRRRRRSRDRP